MDQQNFDKIVFEIRENCFMMNDEQASEVIDEYIERYPELLDFKTREWLIKYC